MSRKMDFWMPLYIGEYLADTGHLSTVQHGAYLLLIMHYWRKRGLPDDDKQLAAIAKLPLRLWLDCKETIQAFFHDGWKHKRVDEELAVRSAVSQKRAIAGAKGGQNRSKSEANASFCSSMIQEQEQKEDRIGDVRAGASVFTSGSKALAAALWKALGIPSIDAVPPELAGTDYRAVVWERAGWTIDLVTAEARRVGPGKPLSYYEKVFATAHAKRQAPLPVVEVKPAEEIHVQADRRVRTESLGDVARRHAAAGIAFGPKPTGLPSSDGERESRSPVRLLSEG